MKIELVILTEVALGLSWPGSFDTQTVLELTGDPFQEFKANNPLVNYHEDHVTGLILGLCCMI